MKLTAKVLGMSATLCFASAGCSADHGDGHDGGAALDDAGATSAESGSESTLPADLVQRIERAVETDAGGGEVRGSARQRCDEPAELCDGTQSDCRNGRPDELDEPMGGNIFDSSWNFVAERAKEAGEAFSSVADKLANGFGSKGVDLTAYNAVLGYRIRFECELENGSRDYVQRGSYYSPMGLHQCDLRANVTSVRRVRMIVERESDGHRVWQNMITISPSVGKTVGTEKIGQGRSGTGILIPLEGGLSLHAAFYSTGWSKVGVAGNRNQGALYLTYDRSHWMADIQRGTPLSEWVLPGSHDAGMYTYDGFLNLPDNLSMTQSESMAGQLEAGMRYFDLRIATANFCRGLGSVLYDIYPESACAEAVHGFVAGAPFHSMMRETFDFLTAEHNRELIVLHFTHPGTISPTKLATDRARVAAWVRAVAEKRGLPPSFVRIVDGDKHDDVTATFKLSYRELVDAGTRIIVVYNGKSSNDSWNEPDYEKLNIAPNVVHAATTCLSKGKDEWFGSKLQLQGTGTLKTGVSQSLQGNKLVFDRLFDPWLARGNAHGCQFGPTFVLNDFVDNAFTDSVMRGSLRTPPKPREQFDVDDQADNVILPDSAEWAAGDLLWHSKPVVLATQGHVLTLQEDGNVVLYKVARDKNARVCNRKPVFATDTVGRGARFDFQRDGNLVVYDEQGRPLWHTATLGPDLRLSLADGRLSIQAKRDWGTYRPWTSGVENLDKLSCK